MANIRSFDGTHPRLGDGAWVDETAVVIGDVTIGARASIWPMSVIRGDVHHIEIGADSNIQDGSILHVSHDSRFLPGGAPLIIHEQVTIGHQAALHGCEIKDLCLIGTGSRILDRAVIEPHSVIAAGALVPPGQVLESGYLWVGAPAKRKRPLTDKELEHLVYNAEHYVRLAACHGAVRDTACG